MIQFRLLELSSDESFIGELPATRAWVIIVYSGRLVIKGVMGQQNNWRTCVGVHSIVHLKYYDDCVYMKLHAYMYTENTTCTHIHVHM